MTPADSHHQLRTAGFLTFAFAAGLVFGILVLVGGDWLPGTIIVVATAIGLATQVAMIRRRRHRGVPPTPPSSTATHP